MRTLWGVTSGDYSDYTVHVLCETEEGAKEVAERMQRHQGGWCTYSVQDLPLVSPEEAKEVPVLVLTARPASKWAAGPLNERSAVERYWSWEAAECSDYGGHDGFGLTVLGADFERVRKVYGERRAEFLAHLNGLT